MIEDYIDKKGHIAHNYHGNVLEKIYWNIYPEQREAFVAYRAAWNRADALDDAGPFPLNLDVELVDACNLSCTFCYRGDAGRGSNWKPRPTSRLGLEKTREIIDQCAANGLPAIWFGASGEGLLEKRLPEMIAYARERGIIDRILTTNGQLLSQDKSRAILEAGLTRISISVDAFTKATYEETRGSDYENLLRNIHEFLRLKKEMRLELPVVRLTFVDTARSHEEKDDFITYWRDLVDIVDIQKQIFYQNTRLSRDEIEPIRCAYPWRAAVLYANGDLALCSSHWGRDDLVMGNIHDTPIREIWCSEKARDLRESIRSHNYRQCCINCMGKKKGD